MSPTSAPELTVAEELRQAAALIRERADAATLGPWKHMCMGSDGCMVTGRFATIRDRRGPVAWFGRKEWKADHADAVHVAGWDPVTAHAVADWLQVKAANLEKDHDYGYALAVARAYLDEGQS